MESRTQAEDKAHSFSGPINDSFRNTLGHHDQMQSPSCTANKGTAFSYDVDIPFHAGLSLMKSGNLPTRRWTDDNLSSLHSGPGLNADSTQHHTFDHASRLLAIEDDFNVDSGVLFQDPKEHLADRPSRPTASNWMQQQQIYKYNLPSVTGEARHHKSNGSTVLTRKVDLFSDPTLSPTSSPSPGGTMAYQDNWFHQRLENYGIQQMVQSPGCSASNAAASYSQALDRRESLSHLSTVSRDSDRSPLDNNTPMSTPRYSSTLMSHTAHSPPIPTTSDSSEPSCQRYQDSAIAVTIPSHTSPPPPPPRQILRSQPCDVPSMNSWHSEPIDISVFQCSQPNIQRHESEQWWTTAPSQAISNTNVQPPFPHASYSSAVTPTPMPFRNQHQRFIHIPESMQSSGLMIHMDTTSPEITTSIQEPAMSVPPLPCSEAALTPAYSSLPYIPPQHQRTHQPPPIQTSHLSIPISHSAPTISGAPRSAPVISRRLTPGSIPQQSPKSRYHVPAHQRRGQHSRKAASFSGQATKCTKATSSNTSTHSSISANCNNVINKAAKNVSFVNFTPEDSHKLLSGVAPSGSSKTKARREQEARDKRRKLSEAALMAVRRAGGDVEALEAVFC
ncbi:wetA [Arthroderma uncinatum]|uniref:wetA n=1 Tax=Arthroderma uncinatum TaxID=74035 RepID=UPI00144AE81B|nr:wetA [Arthroderma uncinatum]KAF3491780.1 wetA [Arthroderma uncinatum]